MTHQECESEGKKLVCFQACGASTFFLLLQTGKNVATLFFLLPLFSSLLRV